MEDLKKRDHLKRPRRKLEGVDWIQLFRREAIGVLVITVVNSQVLYKVGIFLTSEEKQSCCSALYLLG
jgi:hypothetical protein